MTAVTVDGQKQISASAYILSINAALDFIPGQMLGVQISREIEPRLYSIASPPGGSSTEILYTVVPNGQLTPGLSRLKTGDTVYISKPGGDFSDTGKNSWWIANGSGVAPFISMYGAGQYKDKTLIHGARTPEDFYRSELFLSNPDAFNYIPCCSDVSTISSANSRLAKRIYPGRLTTFLSEYSGLAVDGKYYLCGSEQMIIQVRQLLISRGVPFANIISEIYF